MSSPPAQPNTERAMLEAVIRDAASYDRARTLEVTDACFSGVRLPIWRALVEHYEQHPGVAPGLAVMGDLVTPNVRAEFKELNEFFETDIDGCATRLVAAARERKRTEHLKRGFAAVQNGDDAEAEAQLARAIAAVRPSEPHGPIGTAPSDIAMRWANEGPLIRLATGIEPLDRMCRGGLPVPWRVFIVGAPSAGKTALETVIADHLAGGAHDAGACIGILAVDEEPEDITVRLAQIAGYSVADIETRDPVVMVRIAAALSKLRVRLYDASSTIDAAAADLGAWCKPEGRPGVLFIDSVQTVQSAESFAATSPRELVEANVRAIRRASAEHKLLVITTSEANRATYRNAQSAEQNPLAAGAESRAIEFGAQTQIVLSTPKGHANTIHVQVSKNRRADKGEFWLQLDRDRHTITECEKPTDEGGTDTRDSKREQAEITARALLPILLKSPGLSSRDVRAAAQQAGLGGADKCDAATYLLRSEGIDGYRLANRGTDRRPSWFIESTANGGMRAA